MLIQFKINKSIWNLVYVKKNNYFPDNKTKTGTSGVWLCEENYSWKFSYYAGKNMDEAMIHYGKYRIEKDYQTMNNEKIYLKPGDLVVADNVLLMFDGIKYILTADGLNPALKCIFDEKTDQEYPIEYEVVKNDIRPYYTKNTNKFDEKE